MFDFSLPGIMSALRDFLWGVPCTVLLIGFGIYLTLGNRMFPVNGLASCIRSVIQADKSERKGGISALSALSTALGGTVGIGSIVGIAFALETGGAGALFWMWVSGFFCITVKYAECALAVKHRVMRDGRFVGGAMYIFDALGKKRSAVAFAITVIVSSVATGSVTQTNAACEMMAVWNIPRQALAVIFAATAYAVISGGQRKIGKANALIMPLASAAYLLMTGAVIVINFASLPEVMKTILSHAFDTTAIAGGAGGTAMIVAFRTGFSKGVFSNEAGMGSSPIAHAASDTASPHTQGVWGMFEVFFDTFVVSTFTGFALLSGGFGRAEDMFGFYYGDAGQMLFILLTVVFAFAAMLSWCFYAESSIAYLTDKKIYPFLFRVAFAASVYVGAGASVDLVWISADLTNAAMIFQNVFLLVSQRKAVNGIIGSSVVKHEKAHKRQKE